MRFITASLLCVASILASAIAGAAVGPNDIPATTVALQRAAFYQRTLTWDVPIVNTQPTATHNSFNDEQSHPFAKLPIEAPNNQKFNITNQLTYLGVRQIELDPHFVYPYLNKTLLCHLSPEAAGFVYQQCNNTLGFPTCNALGIFDFGPFFSGCSPLSQTFESALGEVRDFLLGNPNEVVIVKLDDQMVLNPFKSIVSSAVTSIFQRLLYTPADLAKAGGTFPSTRELIRQRKRVLVFSQTAFDGVTLFNYNELVATQTALKFATGQSPCPANSGLPLNLVQGDSTAIAFNGQILYNGPATNGLVLPAIVPAALQCGYTPAFDRMDVAEFQSTIWSWDVAFPDVSNNAVNKCVYLNRATGKFRNGPCKSTAKFSACLKSDSSSWILSEQPVTNFYASNGNCPVGYSFSVPRTAFQMAQLLQATNSVGGGNDADVWVQYKAEGEGNTGCFRAGVSARTPCFD